MNVAHAKRDLVVGDLCLSVIIDFGREALHGVVLRANHLGVTVDRVLDEGEQVFDCRTQLPVDRLTGLKIEHAGDRVAQHENVERMDVRAEAAALDGERVRVETLCPPQLVRRVEVGGLMSRGGGVAARNGDGERCEAAKAKLVHMSITGAPARASPWVYYLTNLKLTNDMRNIVRTAAGHFI